MASAQDYADKCLEWAAAAASDQDRQILRRMALAWWRITRLTEEGQSLDEREESGAQSLTRPALTALSFHNHTCICLASTSLVAPQSARHDTAMAVGLSTQDRCT